MDGIIALSILLAPVIFYVSILLAPVIFYVIYYCRHSDKSVYKKNLFDWIVYILAWLAVPFFIISALAFVHRPLTYDFVHRPLVVKCKNWEEHIRLNLYILLLICYALLFFWLFCICMPIEYFDSNRFVAYIIWLFFSVFLIVPICVLYKLMEKYEKYIENKSYIPENTHNVKKE